MGSYLANEVVTSIGIYRSERWPRYNCDFDLNKEIDSVLQDLNNVIDTSLYELTNKEDNYYKFTLKKDFFHNNIHALLNELSDLTYPVDYVTWDDQNKKIIINFEDKEYMKKHPYKIIEGESNYIEIEKENTIEERNTEIFWLGNERIRNNTEIWVSIILTWCEADKYIGEDPSNMLTLLNHMKTKYYKSPLSKALIYYLS